MVSAGEAIFIQDLLVVYLLLVLPCTETRRPLAGRLSVLLRKGRTGMKITIIFRKQRAFACGGPRRCPLVDIFGFRRTLTIVSCLSAQRLPLRARVCIHGTSLLPSACDPLESTHPRKRFGVSIKRLLQCDVSRDSGGTYSVLLHCVNNAKIISGCIHALNVRSFGVRTGRRGLGRTFRCRCLG